MEFKNMVKKEGAFFTYIVKVLLEKSIKSTQGIFPFRNQDIQNEIGGMSRKIGELKKRGVELGFWEIHYLGLPKTTHFKVNVKKIYKWLETNNKGI